jgi:hypothetical protein
MAIPRREVVAGQEPLYRRVSWGSVLAGALLGVMVLIVLNMLALGIGLQTIRPTTQDNPLEGLGTGLTVSSVIILLIAFFVSGWTAGRLAGFAKRSTAILHGLLAWGVLTLATLTFLTNAVGGLVSGVTGAVGQGLTLVGQGAAALAPGAAQAVEDALAAQGVNLEDVAEEVATLVQQATDGQAGQQAAQLEAEAEDAATTALTNPQQAGREINRLVRQLFLSTDATAQQVSEDDLVQALVANTDLSEPEARQTVQNWQQLADDAQAQLAQAQATLEQAAEDAARAVGRAAIWAFIALLIAAVVAAVGAVVGSPREDRVVYRG